MKQCSKCKIPKPIKEFHKASRFKDGLQKWCKVCISAYREDKIEKYRKSSYDWFIENREKARVRSAEWAANNREVSRQRTRAWQVSNPEKVKVNHHKRRALILGTEATLTHAEWLEILEDYMSLCFWCGHAATTQDHLIPLSKGGTHSADNVIPACQACNSKKYNKDPLDFLLSIS